MSRTLPPCMSFEMETLFRGQMGSIRLAVAKSQRLALDNRDLETVSILEEISVEVDFLEQYLFPPSADGLPD